MRRTLSLLLMIFLGTPALAKSPIAEVLCEPTSAMHTKLKHQFGGLITATGIRDPEQVMEVWTDRRGNWTMVVSYATGTSCIVAMGEDWIAMDQQDRDMPKSW